MRKLIFLPLVIGATFSFSHFIFAQEKEIIFPPFYQGRLFGQEHYYQVVFDGEGEATVAAKLSFQNTSQKILSLMTVEIPGNNIRMIRAIQEVYEEKKRCQKWEEICLEEKEKICLRYEKKCKKWFWYVETYNPTYYTLEPKEEILSGSVKYLLELKKPIEELEQTSLLLYYKVPNQAKKKWGIFHFAFETAKVPYDITKLRVAISVQEGFYLKGGKVKTKYRPSFQSVEEVIAPMRGIQNRALSEFSRRIEYAQGYVKETRGLDPWESFIVKGKYSSSWFLLYKKEILLFLVAPLVFFVFLGVGIGWIIKRQHQKFPETPERKRGKFLSLKVVGLGFACAISIVTILYLSWVLLLSLPRVLGHQYEAVFAVFTFLLVGILVLFFLVIPPLYMGLKYGLVYGVWTLFCTIFILGIILVLTAIFFISIESRYS